MGDGRMGGAGGGGGADGAWGPDLNATGCRNPQADRQWCHRRFNGAIWTFGGKLESFLAAPFQGAVWVGLQVMGLLTC